MDKTERTYAPKFREAKMVVLKIAQAVRSQANLKLVNHELKALLVYIRHLEWADSIAFQECKEE